MAIFLSTSRLAGDKRFAGLCEALNIFFWKFDGRYWIPTGLIRGGSELTSSHEIIVVEKYRADEACEYIIDLERHKIEGRK